MVEQEPETEPETQAEDDSPQEPLAAESGFHEMGLSQSTLRALAAAEYIDPSPIQAGLIPLALKGVDVMGQARTGTGKTAAFALPILERIEAGGRGAAPQALVLAPTRELAVQVRDEFAKLARGSRKTVLAVYGGKPIRQQTERLLRGADVCWRIGFPP